tara:strand:- start:7965 stop:8285 length:321 start_codon:yes stop_codon:yes gene_type:complete
MSRKKTVPGPWRVAPCPEKGGLHPLHDNRWIIKEGDEFGEGFCRIAKMMDIQGQKETAQLIANAPAMARTLEQIGFALHAFGDSDDSGLRDTIASIVKLYRAKVQS